MTTVRALTPIKHDGSEYLPNDELDVSSSQAKRLIVLGAAEPVCMDPSIVESDADPEIESGSETDADPEHESGSETDADSAVEPSTDTDSNAALNVPPPPPPADPDTIDSKPSGRKLFGKKGK